MIHAPFWPSQLSGAPSETNASARSATWMSGVIAESYTPITFRKYVWATFGDHCPAMVTAGAAAEHEALCGSIVSSVPIAFGLARTSATVWG